MLSSVWRHFQRIGVLAVALIGFGPVSAAAQDSRAMAAAASAPRLPPIQSWGYQLQHLDVAAVAHSPFDLIVTDITQVTGARDRVRMSDIRRMKQKPDGKRRIVLAYLSIGEAETYRFYWNKDWVEPVKVVLQRRKEQFDETTPATEGAIPHEEPSVVVMEEPPEIRVLHYPKLSAPAWLGHENESWPSNFFVRYWLKEWQDIIFGSPDAYLERLIAAGFDGVYLDRVDAYLNAEPGRPTARAEMAAFVIALARHARRLDPRFIVVPQNGEELLTIPEYLAEIDGIAKEDLFFGYNEGERNPVFFVRNSLAWLAPAKARGLPVLVVEYLQDSARIREARAQILERGFVPFFSDRGLTLLRTVEEWTAGPETAAAATDAAARPGAPAPHTQGRGQGPSPPTLSEPKRRAR